MEWNGKADFEIAHSIGQCLSLEAKRNAEQIAHDIEVEGDGAQNAVEAFHRHLPLFGENTMRCCIFQDRVAVWVVKDTRLTLSSLAVELLIKKAKLKWRDLRLTRHCDWNDFEGPGEPITGAGAALAKSFGDIAKGIGGVPVRWAKSLKKHEQDKDANGDAVGRLRNNNTETSSISSNNSPSCVARESHPIEDANGDAVGRPLNNTETASPSSSDNSSSENIAQELAEETGKGFAKSGQALAKVPMDLSLAIAQGFHNAPRLYGDTTVRPTARVTGFHSGLRAAGEELVFGVYDGVTGLVLQPYHGAKQHGTLGFFTGFGKGLGGFVLKDLAAVIAPVAYTSKGIHKELTKGRQPTALVRRARIFQGHKEFGALDEAARQRDEQQVEVAWKFVREIMEELETNGKEGLQGRLRRTWEMRKLGRQGAFKGSVWSAKKVVEEKQKTRFIEDGGNAGREKSRMVRFKRDKRDDQADGPTEQNSAQNNTTGALTDSGIAESPPATDISTKELHHPDHGGNYGKTKEIKGNPAI